MKMDKMAFGSQALDRCFRKVDPYQGCSNLRVYEDIFGGSWISSLAVVIRLLGLAFGPSDWLHIAVVFLLGSPMIKIMFKFKQCAHLHVEHDYHPPHAGIGLSHNLAEMSNCTGITTIIGTDSSHTSTVIAVLRLARCLGRKFSPLDQCPAFQITTALPIRLPS